MGWCPVASWIGVPPPTLGSFRTAPSPKVTQWTWVASRAMPYGHCCAGAKTTGWQAPPEQSPPWQSCPQAPQFSGSLVTSAVQGPASGLPELLDEAPPAPAVPE